MSFENPFRRNKPAAVPEESARALSQEEVAATREHFNSAQESGLTAAQEAELDKWEPRFALFEERLAAFKQDLEKVRSLPEGSGEKYEEAYRLNERVKSDSMGLLIHPASMWNDRPDPVLDGLKDNDRFAAFSAKNAELREERKKIEKDIDDLYNEVRYSKKAG